MRDFVEASAYKLSNQKFSRIKTVNGNVELIDDFFLDQPLRFLQRGATLCTVAIAVNSSCSPIS